MGDTEKKHRIFGTSVASAYLHYVARAAKKGRSRAEVDQIIRWLTGHAQPGLEAALAQGGVTFEDSFATATATVCGEKV
jgi:hypothetical protein